ncbi:outer membrane lipoprotein LolB [Nitrosospira sp. Nl5]|uniref:lipoprotein insertase outer membrane protein LolB n=1 Tax=Nitrosospira sp. Nl5 TaxID=200120 RepID=UPI00087EF2D1|nr:lipoprotein insertase outer membrane protein LolB [Nitrosospira sp. Nl5]SCY38569.1 outer membrane lipoprotein LolB [Nitrosospira sp. Nl5]
MLVKSRFSLARLFFLLNKRIDVPWWGLIACVLPFAACTTLPPKNNIVSTIVTEPGAGAADTEPANFGLVGRVSVKGGKESFSGGIQWHHTESTDEILLLSPLGQTLAQIRGDPEGVYLTTSEQESYYAADVESLTEQVLGWRLPLAGLQYWVRGMNSPATAAEIDMDANARVAAIRQDGWEISYLSYFPMVQTQMPAQIAEPKLLMLNRGSLQIKLVIDHWDPGKL